MSEREKVPWETLIQQWEGETPLLLNDQVIGQLVQSAKETEKELRQHKEHIQTLTLMVSEIQTQRRVSGEGGGQDE